MTGVKEMAIAASAGIENLAPADVAAELGRPGVLLVDVREPAETAHGVIPGAVLVPRGMLEFHADRTITSHLDGFDPGRRVILYCAAGGRSALAARSLQELGYRDVAHLHGGLAAWLRDGRPVVAPARCSGPDRTSIMSPVQLLVAAVRASIENLTPAKLATELDDPFVLLVDVREPDETQYGCIPNAVLIPRGMLEFHADHGTHHVEGLEPGRRVIVYCAAGSRSALAIRSPQELGYRDVAHLDGGINGWISAGRPMTGPTTRTRTSAAHITTRT
jgi:rhodanese-related sulfurtransferase